MRKTDKKVDNLICKALTDVCENALEDYKGFEWLTHLVNYSSFPKSLKIVCVFDTNANLTRFMTSANQQSLCVVMKEKLNGIGVDIRDMASHIAFDTEENCDNKDGGDWGDRLKRKSHFN